MSFLWNRRWTFSSYFHDGSQWAQRLLQQFHDFASHLVDSPQSVVHVCKHSFRSHFYLTIKRASSSSKVLWASGLFGFAARHLITEQTSSLELRRSFILACWLPYWEIKFLCCHFHAFIFHVGLQWCSFVWLIITHRKQCNKRLFSAGCRNTILAHYWNRWQPDSLRRWNKHLNWAIVTQSTWQRYMSPSWQHKGQISWTTFDRIVC